MFFCKNDTQSFFLRHFWIFDDIGTFKFYSYSINMINKSKEIKLRFYVFLANQSSIKLLYRLTFASSNHYYYYIYLLSIYNSLNINFKIISKYDSNADVR